MRTGVGRALGGLLALLLSLPLPGWCFGYADVVEQARKLSEKGFSPPPRIPKFLRELRYDQLRDIRFRPEKSLWRAPGSHFDLQFFHPGGVYDYAVKINVHDSEGVHPVPFSVDNFDYGKNAIAGKVPGDLGYAGFKVYYPLNRPDVRDEVVSFVGASYFRALAKDTLYGLSARGLAIDTGLESGEEFPLFREFWIDRPSPKSTAIRIYALLDSKRITGAYRFVVFPGETTRMDVLATLFTRKKIREPGIAPLTSMFHYGENGDRPAGHWRPEVHDSDGLMLLDGNGEQLWRPLVNAGRLRLSQLQLRDPKGFGLLQRDRDFDHYQDLETHMEKRPSAWITPLGDWGKGYVKLTEIPTDNEFNDNIVAYWTPREFPPPGEPFEIRYRIEWGKTFHGPARSEVVNTFVGRGKGKHHQRFVIDFQPADPRSKTPGDDVQADVWVAKHGKLVEQHVQPNPRIGGWRLSFEIENASGKPLELRAFLKQGDETLSETWSYLAEAPE